MSPQINVPTPHESDESEATADDPDAALPDLAVELPRTQSALEIRFVPLTISHDGSVLWAGQAVTEEQLVKLATERQRRNPELAVVLRVDRTVSYGRLIQIMELLKQSGVTRFSFAVSAATNADASP